MVVGMRADQMPPVLDFLYNFGILLHLFPQQKESGSYATLLLQKSTIYILIINRHNFKLCPML